MDIEVLHAARNVTPRQNGVCRTPSTSSVIGEQDAFASTLARPSSGYGQSNLPLHPGLPYNAMPVRQASRDQFEMSQGGAGLMLSKEAMLVGTVAALQEESGQMRNQWQSDVSRLENELQQLRSAAAWALPQVRHDTEPPVRLMMTGPAAERGGGGVALVHHSSSFGSLPARDPVQFDAPLMSNVQADRGGLGSAGLFSREAAQLDAAVFQSAVSERACRERVAEAPMIQRSTVDRSGSNLAEAVLSQMRTNVVEQPPVRTTQAAESNNVHGAASAEVQDLYRELERMTIALQEAQQEGSKLREEKEAAVDAHARDVAALEGMMQQLSAENSRLTEQLSQTNAKLRQLQMDGLDPDLISRVKQHGGYAPSTASTSIRSASVEPAIEPDAEQASELDKSFEVHANGGFR